MREVAALFVRAMPQNRIRYLSEMKGMLIKKYVIMEDHGSRDLIHLSSSAEEESVTALTARDS